MKIISWNVNGLKSVIEKGFQNVIFDFKADIICIQEIKITKEIELRGLESYYKFYNFPKVGGQSGVAIFSKIKPEKVIIGIPNIDQENLDNESRVITLEYNSYYIVSVYVPNPNSNAERKRYRNYFDNAFFEFIETLNQEKDVIICGDFNICFQSIDICNLKKHKNIDLFSDDERFNFNNLLDLGFIDTYRYMHPQMRKYTFWNGDEKRHTSNNWGWRLDYILISDYMRKNIRQANIYEHIKASDHCPIELIIEGD